MITKLALGAMAAGLMAGLSPSLSTRPQVRVVDGDTIVVNGERIRLNGVDAPEMPGHCRRGRHCVVGDPFASAAHLRSLIARSKLIAVVPLKTDRYGRTVAQVTADGIDLSCYQIGDGNGIYVAKWDEGGRTAAACE